MYKKFSFIIALLLFINAEAQFSVGIRQGYGAYGIHLEPASIEKYQVPYLLPNSGIVFIYNNINNAGIQMEINYAKKGWQEKDTSMNDSYYKRTIDYLEIPIFSRWEIGYGKFKPIIFAGPYLAFKLNESTDSLNFSHIWNSFHPYNHYEQDIKSIDFGIKLGLGLKYSITKKLVVYLDARYDFEFAGGRDIFIDHPNDIQASRLKELSASFGIVWHIIPQKKEEDKEIYVPKEDLYDDE
jgi:opacity protein-like surface antigen